MGDLFYRLKKDKQFRFDFIIGFWSVIIIIGIIICIIIGVIFASDKMNDDSENAQPSETPVVSVSPAPTEDPYDFEDDDFIDDEDFLDDDFTDDDFADDDSDETVYYEYATTNVNIRSSASTDSLTLGKLLAGSRIEVSSELNNGWKEVVYNGKTAYVKAEYLTDDVTMVQTSPDNSTSNTTTNTQTSATQRPASGQKSATSKPVASATNAPAAAATSKPKATKKPVSQSTQKPAENTNDTPNTTTEAPADDSQQTPSDDTSSQKDDNSGQTVH